MAELEEYLRGSGEERATRIGDSDRTYRECPSPRASAEDDEPQPAQSGFLALEPADAEVNFELR